MNLRALHHPTDQAGVVRWTTSAAVIVATHLGLIAAAVAWYHQSEPPGVAIPAILIDMAPANAAPAPQPDDFASGPEMQQAEEAAPPEPKQQQDSVQHLEPVPPQDKAEVVLPPEQKIAPSRDRSEPVKTVATPPKPVVKPKPPREVSRRPSEQPPAPQTSAAPKAERHASLASAASAGAMAAVALPDYRARLAAHLQKFKQYPAGSKSAGEQGIAILSFTVGRSGQVLSSRLAGSSGHSALDAETLAMIRRAQPLPAFPPELTQTSLSFSVPISFSLR
jgi:protein TonB